MNYVSNEVLKIYNGDNFGLEVKKDKSPLTLADKNLMKF